VSSSGWFLLNTGVHRVAAAFELDNLVSPPARLPASQEGS
jgi:hypothetical protein